MYYMIYIKYTNRYKNTHCYLVYVYNVIFLNNVIEDYDLHFIMLKRISIDLFINCVCIYILFFYNIHLYNDT